ncbi:hypothetical protein N665_0195s0014 [Sinapis alba]|nr:hypothetical protein N665_0195s0014 [Sinapis alba]
MSSGGRLSRKQKGKAVASESSPARDVDMTPLDDFELVHREAMMDTRSLGLPKRLLVSESSRLHRTRDGQGGARDGTPSVDFVPICYYPGGIFEELPPVSPELLRPVEARGQTWGNVLSTRSTVGSVKRLLRECIGVGVTFLVPTEEHRPWSPPLGFQCVYESYFQGDTKLWFPIPRLITLYARRQDAAISQFLNGSWRLSVALMVTASEINMTLNVRAFEEWTSVNPLDEGLWSIKMRPNYNVVKGYPNKTVDWQRSYFYVKSDSSAFEDPPDNDYRVLWNALLGDHPTSREYPKEFLSNARAIARLQPERWANISRDRIRLCLDRIFRSKFMINTILRFLYLAPGFTDFKLFIGDWSSIYLPATNTVKRRISIFTRDEQREINASRGMKGLPDLSAMMASQLGLSRPESTDLPGEVKASKAAEIAPACQDPPPVASAAPAKKRSSKKMPRDDLPIREVHETSSKGVDVAGQENTTATPRARKKKRQPSDAPSPAREELGLNLPVEDDLYDSSPSASAQLTRKPRKTNEQGASCPEAPTVVTLGTTAIPNVSEGPALAIAGTSTGGVPMLKKVLRVVFPDRVSFDYNGPSPLIYVPQKCAELVSQIRGGPRSLPPMADLIFKDEYVDAACTKLLKLKEKMAAKGRFFRRKTTEWTAAYEEMVAKKERAIARRKIHQERANVAEADLRVANSTILALEKKAGQLKEKIDRLRGSHVFEVTKEQVRVETEMIAKCNKRFSNIRDYQVRRVLFDTMQLLQSQAFGTRKCLEALKASGRDIPQETIDMFAAQEKQFEEEALKLDVGEIPEADLSLSPLKLDSQTATLLHTPRTPRGVNTGTSASPDPHPTNENTASILEGDHSAILLLSDSSAEGQEEDGEGERSVAGQEDRVGDDDVGEAAEEQDAVICEASQPLLSPEAHTIVQGELEEARMGEYGGAVQVGSQDGEGLVGRAEETTDGA